MAGMQFARRGMAVAAMMVALLVLAACVGTMPAASDDHAGHEMTTTVPSAETPESDEAAAEAADEQAADAGHAGHAGHAPMAVDPELFDAQFIDGMIVHHLGAVAMAEQVLEESERPELRAMAEEIIATQSEEIEQMTAWRDEWYPDLEATTGLTMDMGAMEIGTDPDKSFDQRFLEAMIDHHEGAVEMAEMALESARNSELRTMAEEVIVVQQGEINQMRAWLSEWFDVE